jgi:hypothetical protein
MHEDILGRPIAAGDYVVYYSNIYQVIELLKHRCCRIKLVDPSKTTKPVRKSCPEMCVVDKEDVLIWKIKRVTK